MEIKTIVKYIIVIIIIFVIVFLGQQAYFKKVGKNVISDATDVVGGYLAKGSNWVASQVYPKISGEVEKRGDIIQNEINNQTKKASESVTEKIKNYFSGITDSIIHPGQNDCECQTQPTTN